MSGEIDEAPAFRVGSVGITAEQRDAGIAAMHGRFRAWDVRGALTRAGVPYEALDRAADRLLQAERRAGRIRAINNRNWERQP